MPRTPRKPSGRARSPADRKARQHYPIAPFMIGDAAGGWLAVALTINRAWSWRVPAAVRILPGAALITAIGLLAVAAPALLPAP